MDNTIIILLGAAVINLAVVFGILGRLHSLIASAEKIDKSLGEVKDLLRTIARGKVIQ